MAPEQTQLPMVEISPKSRCCNMSYMAMGLVMGMAMTVLLGVAYYVGRQSQSAAAQSVWNGIPISRVPQDLLSATASHGGVNMAVCTAPVDENAEGFFVLDYVTGNLQGWVYYPRLGQFGGKFVTNVVPQLGMSKNPEYLLVSGATASTPTGGNTRPAGSLIYVVDMRSGYFAAYTIPWSRVSENSAVSQMGQFIFVGGDQIREPWGAGKKPANPPANGAAAPGAKKPAAPANNNQDPNADPDADANDPAQPGAPAQPGNNRNPNNPKGKK